MTGIRDTWDRFWFSDGDPRNLAAARILVAVHAAWVVLSRDLPPLSDLPPAFWRPERTEALQRFLLVPGMSGAERLLLWSVLGALVLVAAGMAVRIAAPWSAVVLYHLAPLQTIVATPDPINRGFTIAILCLVVLSATPCADRWSLRRLPPRADGSREYGWGLKLMQLFVAQIYLFGLIGKLRASGLAWFSAANLRRNLTLYLHMHPDVRDFLVMRMASHDALLRLLAVGVLIFEGSFILAVFSRRARRILVPVALLFHLFVLRSMRIVFANVTHLGLFVNWGWIADRLPSPAQRLRSSAGPWR